MSRVATAADIILRARYAADGETATPTTDFVTDIEALAYLSAEYRALINLIIEAGGLDLLLTSTTLASPYTLPADFFREAALEQGSGTSWLELKRFNFRERNNYSDGLSTPRWRILNGAILLEPATSAPASLRLWYVPDFAVVSSTSTTVAVYNGWDEYLVQGIAARMLIKEDRDPNTALGLKLAAEASIRTACRDLCVIDTEVIADVERTQEDYYDWS